MNTRLADARLALALGLVTVAGPSVLAAPASAAPPLTPALFSIAAQDVVPGTCEQADTPGLEACLEKQVLAVDRQIDAAARGVLASALPASGPDTDYVDVATDLNTSQRSWLAFRRADCLSWSDKNLGGTIAGVDFGQCELQDSRARLGDLRAQLAFYKNP